MLSKYIFKNDNTWKVFLGIFFGVIILVGTISLGFSETTSEPPSCEINDKDCTEFVYHYGRYEKLDRDNPQSIKEQLANGVPYNKVICYDGYQIVVYRVSDGSPACVDESNTSVKLVKRGWATFGNSSLSITTDKTEYAIGEPITIIMKNGGDTTLLFGCSPDFAVYREHDVDLNGIVLPVPMGFLCDSLFPFDTLSTTTLVWNQYDYYGKAAEPGTYKVIAEYMYRYVSDESDQLQYDMLMHNATFTILP